MVSPISIRADLSGSARPRGGMTSTPMSTRIAPAICPRSRWLSWRKYEPKSPAAAPRAMNTTESPVTNATAWLKVTLRSAVSRPFWMLEPEIWAMKIGTMGRTHGEKNESTPAEKARNGPAGPSRLKLELVSGPMANASTGMRAKSPRIR